MSRDGELKSLFIAAVVPYPPNSGAPIRAWQNINILATRGPVHVVSMGSRAPNEHAMPVAAEWVHFDDAEFPRRRGIRSMLTRLLYQRQYPLPDVLATSTIDRELRALVDRINPDVVVISHWKNGYPAALKAHPNVILDMHNVESVLGGAVRHIRPRFIRALLLWRWRARERRLVKSARLTWVCGDNDVAQLKRLDPRLPPPVIWPNAVDLAYYADIRAGIAPLPDDLTRDVATIVYIGIFGYEPNRLAAGELISHVLPAIAARRPKVRLLLVGDAPTAEMVAAAKSDSRIIVTGKVADVRPYLALSDLCIIPIWLGGGTRIKILECFAANVPVVSTPKGAEGIDAVPGRDIRIADSAESLAKEALLLLDEPDVSRRQAASAYALVERSYSWKSLAANLDDALPRERVKAAPSHRVTTKSFG